MNDDARTEFSRDEIVTKILDVMIASKEGYERNASQFSSEVDNEVSQKCATAVSNAAYFMLQSFGFTGEEIRKLYAEKAQ